MKILNIISDILGEMFSLCKNDIIPLQIALVVYDRKDLLTSNSDNVLCNHRTFIVFKKLYEKYIGYYYDPEGNKNIEYTNMINNLMEKLNYDKILIKQVNDICPIGIQSLLKDVDIGLCNIYSHFWYHCFIEIIFFIKKYENLHKIKMKDYEEYIKIFEKEMNKIDIGKYISYINKCITNFVFKVNLEEYKDENNEIKYSLTFEDKSNLSNRRIMEIFLNYGMYIIGYTFNNYSVENKNKLLNYIKLKNKKLVKPKFKII
jgi:hypothetical protein